MKTIKGNVTADVGLSINISLTLGEAKALDAIAGYGTDEFLKVFYPSMGKAYLEPYESDMREFFIKIREQLSIEISTVERVEKQIKEALSSL